MINQERLKKLRKELRLTQYQVADLLYISRASYSAYERGTRQPPLETVLGLADFFDVSADYLLDRTEVPYSLSRLTREEIDIVCRLPSIPEDVKHLIRRIISKHY